MLNDSITFTKPKEQAPCSPERDRLIPLEQWRDAMGRSATTIWRWRKRGWLKAIRIGGHLYITEEALQEFYHRAALGEFITGGAPQVSALLIEAADEKHVEEIAPISK